MKKIIFALVALCAFVSCDETITEPDGYAEDTIHLSTDKLDLTATGGEYVITTKGEHWWINESIIINGENYDLVHEDEFDEMSQNQIIAQYGSFDGSGEQKEIVSFSHDWFSVTKSTSKEIQIKLEPNYTKHLQSLSFTPQAGNYFGNIRVTQKGAEVSNLRFSDVKLEGDGLTLAEVKALTEQIEADAYSGMQSYQDDRVRFFSDEDAAQFVEYKYKINPKEDNITAEESAIIDRIKEWVDPIQFSYYLTLSNTTEASIMFVTYVDVAVRAPQPSPSYFHIDVTDRYKDEYPELEIAIATYRPN